MKADKSSLEGRLNKNIYNLLEMDRYEIKEVPAIELLTPSRLDLVAKYLYVKYKALGLKTDFAERLYLAHIEAFNGFVEADESKKVGKQAFIDSFNSVISSMSENGFNVGGVIPVSTSGTILDGAHRVAASLYYQESVPVVDTGLLSPIFNYEYFLSRGLKQNYIDAMALEYAKLKDDVYMVLVWPSAEGNDIELKGILNRYGDVVAYKEFNLEKDAPVLLVKQAYKGEKWVGNSKDDFTGARNKASWCFSKKGPLRVFMFESSKDMIQMKEEIRELFAIEKHAVHINDTKKETLELAGLLFNVNSMHWLKHAAIREFPWFKRLYSHYGVWLTKQTLDGDAFCVDGSSCLAVYGIREVRDVDYLYAGPGCPGKTGVKEIGCHNDELKYHPVSLDEIVYDPENHFYNDGIKVIAIDVLAKMKSIRAENKDIEDLKLIEAKMENRRINLSLYDIFLRATSASYWKGRVKFLLLKARYYISLFLLKY